MRTSLFGLRHLALALFGIFLLNYTVWSQNLSGSLSGTLGPGTYYVVGTIGVMAGDSLAIEPGTNFLFNGDFDFNIYGKITAVGTETDSIKFVQNPDSSNWNGIDFFETVSDSSRFEYCVFQGSSCIGMDFEGCGPTFRHCTITDNNSGGG